MHGGGSPDGAKLVISAVADLEGKVEIARRLAGVTEEVPESSRK
jgi:4-hydroxybutyryl-CoA dehydratase/vinylacetyl-CoA-Delta-isomerase